MRRNLLAALMVTAVLTGSAFGLNIGDKAPSTDVKMKNVDGHEVSIADAAGKEGTLIIFSCNHCPFVKAWEGRIASIGNAAKGTGVGVIVINSNDPAAYPEDNFSEMQKRAGQLGFTFPYVVDATSDVARAFGAAKTPEVFLFNKDGKLIYHGAIDDSKEAAQVSDRYLQNAVDALVGNKEVATKETKSVGCGIKYRTKA